MPVACVLLALAPALLLRGVAGVGLGLALACYVLVLSLLAFVLFGRDKARARRDARRLREADLWGVALLGGAPGAWWGMRRFRHKTRHARFRLLVPALAILWIAATLYALFRA